MAMTSAPVQERDRRKFIRGDFPPRFAINLLAQHGSIAADRVNVSEGGLCIRLREMLEVRSLVQLELTPTPRSEAPRRRPVKCTGRVTWIMQRLDLRNAPPFLFDTGIEFVDPPPTLRQFLAQEGVDLGGLKRRSASQQIIAEPAAIRGRAFVPRVERTSGRPPRWHLVVSVDGVPCFSEHYPSERMAMAAWATFKRRQAKR